MMPQAKAADSIDDNLVAPFSSVEVAQGCSQYPAPSCIPYSGPSSPNSPLQCVPSVDNVLPSSDAKFITISCRELPSLCPGNHETVVLDNSVDVTSSIAVSFVDNNITIGMHTIVGIPWHLIVSLAPSLQHQPNCSLLLTSITRANLYSLATALTASMCVAELMEVSAEQFSAPLVLSNVKNQCNQVALISMGAAKHMPKSAIQVYPHSLQIADLSVGADLQEISRGSTLDGFLCFDPGILPVMRIEPLPGYVFTCTQGVYFACNYWTNSVVILVTNIVSSVEIVAFDAQVHDNKSAMPLTELVIVSPDIFNDKGAPDRLHDAWHVEGVTHTEHEEGVSKCVDIHATTEAISAIQFIEDTIDYSHIDSSWPIDVAVLHQNIEAIPLGDVVRGLIHSSAIVCIVIFCIPDTIIDKGGTMFLYFYGRPSAWAPLVTGLSHSPSYCQCATFPKEVPQSNVLVGDTGGLRVQNVPRTYCHHAYVASIFEVVDTKGHHIYLIFYFKGGTYRLELAFWIALASPIIWLHQHNNGSWCSGPGNFPSLIQLRCLFLRSLLYLGCTYQCGLIRSTVEWLQILNRLLQVVVFMLVSTIILAISLIVRASIFWEQVERLLVCGVTNVWEFSAHLNALACIHLMAVYLPQNILLGVSQRILVAANVCLSHSLILSLIEFGSNWWHKFIRWFCDYMEEGQRMNLANSRIIVFIAFSGCFKLQPIVSTTPFQNTIVHPLVDFLRSYLSRLRNLLVFLVYYSHADPYTVLAAWGSDIAPFLARWKCATTRCYCTGSTITKTTQLVPWSSTIVSIVVMHISWVWDESIEQGSEGSTFLGVMLLSVSTINTFTDDATMMRTRELKDEDIFLGAYPYSLAINPLRDKSIIASSSYCVIVFTVGRLLRFSQFKLQSLILHNQLVGCSCSQNYTGNSCISVSYTLGIGSCSAATTKDFSSNLLPICQTAYISLCLGDNYRTIGEDFAMYLLYAMPMLQSTTELYAHHYCVEYHLPRSYAFL